MGPTQADHKRLVERARQLVPLLREQSPEAEQKRRLTDETVESLQQAGFFDLLKPRRYGGLESDVTTFMDIVAELGRGCGSAAWVVGQLNIAAWMVAKLSRRLREDVLAEKNAYVALVQQGQVTIERAAGGYRVSGTWPFCSGCLQASWVIAGVMLPDEQGVPAPGMLAIPLPQMEIQDDWRVSGLCATGSHSIIAKDVFVPEARFAWLLPVILGQTTSEDLDAPLYQAPLLPLTFVGAGAPALGLARAMLDEFLAQLPRRPLISTLYENRLQAPMTHRQLAEASMNLDIARLLADRGAAEITHFAERREMMPVDRRVKLMMDITYAVNRCQHLVDTLFGAGGGRSLYASNPLQRIARDMRALSVHPAFSLDANLEMYGRSLLGLPLGVPMA
jgi:3-hydroxy-9,10-secoandrosta-1,3,5(10)-triene-9,17-dione monooxygenase